MRNSREIEREEIWLYLLRNVSKFLSPSLVLSFVVFIFIINFLELKKKLLPLWVFCLFFLCRWTQKSVKTKLGTWDIINLHTHHFIIKIF